MKVVHVVGARPNFVKMAPIKRCLDMFPEDFDQTIVHTGQHYDREMSGTFFDELDIPEPDFNLGIGSGSHAWQVAKVMLEFESLIVELNPDLVSLVGDVNATLACALVCSKMDIRISHVEAGLRSYDRRMPEEINRIITDQISDILLTPSMDGNENLEREGVDPEKIYFVGNVMIDSLVQKLPEAKQRLDNLISRFGVKDYGLLTLHRPSNVDNLDNLTHFLIELTKISCDIPLIFPAHPRTKSQITRAGLEEKLSNSNIHVCSAMGYTDFLSLQSGATFVLTDSGGVQEETTYLGTPCITLRENTERPITLTHGTNALIGTSPLNLKQRVNDALAEIEARDKKLPEFWEGKVSERIATIYREIARKI